MTSWSRLSGPGDFMWCHNVNYKCLPQFPNFISNQNLMLNTPLLKELFLIVVCHFNNSFHGGKWYSLESYLSPRFSLVPSSTSSAHHLHILSTGPTSLLTTAHPFPPLPSPCCSHLLFGSTLHLSSLSDSRIRSHLLSTNLKQLSLVLLILAPRAHIKSYWALTD